jgi:hypothetical protein
MGETCRERGADEGQMLEFVRRVVAGNGDEDAAVRVTVGTPVTIICVRQNFTGVMAGTAAASPALALD